VESADDAQAGVKDRLTITSLLVYVCLSFDCILTRRKQFTALPYVAFCLKQIWLLAMGGRTRIGRVTSSEGRYGALRRVNVSGREGKRMHARVNKLPIRLVHAIISYQSVHACNTCTAILDCPLIVHALSQAPRLLLLFGSRDSSSHSLTLPPQWLHPPMLPMDSSHPRMLTQPWSTTPFYSTPTSLL